MKRIIRGKKKIPLMKEGHRLYYSSMTQRRNKDKEIEELKARNTYLENKNRIFSNIGNLSQRKKTILVLTWVFSIVVLALVFILSITKVTKNPMDTREDYERIIASLDGREWKVSESTKKSLESLFPSSKGEGETTKKGDGISLLVPLSSKDVYSLTFSYKNGRVLSIFGGEVMYLEYSETVYGGGRTLTLLYGKEKIVFKEKR